MDQSTVRFLHSTEVAEFVVTALLRWWDPQPLVDSPNSGTPSPAGLCHTTPPSPGGRSASATRPWSPLRCRDVSPDTRGPPPKRVCHIRDGVSPSASRMAAISPTAAQELQQLGRGTRRDAGDESDADPPELSLTQLYSRWQVLVPTVEWLQCSL
jgi:hypothetical protein